MRDYRIISISVRYLTAVFSSLNSLWVFNIIFYPLTLYSTYFVVSLFSEAIVSGAMITTGEKTIVIAEACVAISAYFLLFLLNMTTPMNLKKRLFSLFFSIGIFFFANLIRIVILSGLFLVDFKYFNLIHLITWHFVSGLFVILIWILTIKTFKIKGFPFYSDFKFLISLAKK